MADHLHLEFEYDEKLGFYQWEKQRKQKLLVTVDLQVDVAHAANSDHLKDTIDYDQVDQIIRGLLAEKHYHLIETFAEAIASALLKKWKTSVKVTVNKPLAIAHAKKISVSIERSNIPSSQE